MNLHPNRVSLILDALAGAMGSIPGISATIVLGSVARGEESWLEINGQRHLSSDVELLVVVKGWRVKADLAHRVRAAAAAVEARHAPHCASSFHIDLSLVAARRLPFLDRRFIHFETRESGRVICGDATILKRIPHITADNLNMSELHAVFIHRLVAVLRAVEGVSETALTIDAARRVICRNGLDLLSVLLPHCGRLEAGYRRRGQAAHKVLPWLAMPAAGDLLIFLDLCLSQKLSHATVVDWPLDELVIRFLSHMDTVRTFIQRQERRPFFRRDYRRMMAAAARLQPRQLAREWRRETSEASLANTLRQAILDRVSEQPGPALDAFLPLLRRLYPSVY